MEILTWQQRKRRILNKHLLPDVYNVQGGYEWPMLSPYKGPLPESFQPYNARVGEMCAGQGVHCHVDDAHFASCWSRPEAGLKKVKCYEVAVAPDFTLWVDAPVCENIEQLRRNRVVGLYWQTHGVRVIPSAARGKCRIPAVQLRRVTRGQLAFDRAPTHRQQLRAGTL